MFARFFVTTPGDRIGMHSPHPEFQDPEGEWCEDTRLLLQNRLLPESRFLPFARERGVRAVQGDPGYLTAMGWLCADGKDQREELLYHPFRIYPLHVVLTHCAVPLSPSSTIDREQLKDLSERLPSYLPSLERVAKLAAAADGAVDLAVILEPVYWPAVSGQYTRSARMTEGAYREAVDAYTRKTRDYVSGLDVEYWAGIHERLRFEAASLDPNDGLYLLLRLTPWHERERLKGAIGGAAWLRQIAEVLRRAFEVVHEVEWPEEDVTGYWPSGARAKVYGSERPLDRPLTAKPYVAWKFGLFTSSVVRWYVEGATEYAAVAEILPRAPTGGIELVDLRGAIKAGKGNIAMTLADGLLQDRALRRFSIISFDTDVAENVRTIRQQVEQDRVVGYISANTPDFEFANFALQELVEVAARLDEEAGEAGRPVREGDWSGVSSSSEFQRRYRELSRRGRNLKGEGWGRALARHAMHNPTAPDGCERPLMEAVRIALQCREVGYDNQARRFTFDPQTFALRRREDAESNPRDPETGMAASDGDG